MYIEQFANTSPECLTDMTEQLQCVEIILYYIYYIIDYFSWNYWMLQDRGFIFVCGFICKLKVMKVTGVELPLGIYQRYSVHAVPLGCK